jgi:hypothetical protein
VLVGCHHADFLFCFSLPSCVRCAAPQHSIPALKTNAISLGDARNSSQELFLDQAVVLCPPYLYQSNGQRLNEVRIAVADVTANSVLCWAPTKVTGQNEYDVLMIALITNPLDGDWSTDGELIEEEIKKPKTYMKGQSTQLLPGGVLTAASLDKVAVNPDWVLGPSSFQPAPVRVSPLLLCKLLCTCWDGCRTVWSAVHLADACEL